MPDRSMPLALADLGPPMDDASRVRLRAGKTLRRPATALRAVEALIDPRTLLHAS